HRRNQFIEPLQTANRNRDHLHQLLALLPHVRLGKQFTQRWIQLEQTLIKHLGSRIRDRQNLLPALLDEGNLRGVHPDLQVRSVNDDIALPVSGAVTRHTLDVAVTYVSPANHPKITWNVACRESGRWRCESRGCRWIGQPRACVTSAQPVL